jgi:hypothetical protein
MSAPSPPPSSRRIAVALDASEQSIRVMGLAAVIAAALQAELEGVFIEDAGLLRAVGLPFTREFRLTTRVEAAVDVQQLERELRAAARYARSSLEQSARRLGCSWSFRVWRGDLEAEILSAAGNAEMFTLSLLGRFAPLRGRSFGGASAVATATGASDAGRATGEGLVISILFNHSAGAARALGAAGKLASGRPAKLYVILQGRDEADSEALRRAALEILGDAGADARFRSLGGSDARAIEEMVMQTGGDLFLVDSENRLLDRRTLWQSLKSVHCPVLIVR